MGEGRSYNYIWAVYKITDIWKINKKLKIFRHHPHNYSKWFFGNAATLSLGFFLKDLGRKMEAE